MSHDELHAMGVPTDTTAVSCKALLLNSRPCDHDLRPFDLGDSWFTGCHVVNSPPTSRIIRRFLRPPSYCVPYRV